MNEYTNIPFVIRLMIERELEKSIVTLVSLLDMYRHNGQIEYAKATEANITFFQDHLAKVRSA